LCLEKIYILQKKIILSIHFAMTNTNQYWQKEKNGKFARIKTKQKNEKQNNINLPEKRHI
jgi:hypothetical protein